MLARLSRVSLLRKILLSTSIALTALFAVEVAGARQRSQDQPMQQAAMRRIQSNREQSLQCLGRVGGVSEAREPQRLQGPRAGAIVPRRAGRRGVYQNNHHGNQRG